MQINYFFEKSIDQQGQKLQTGDTDRDTGTNVNLIVVTSPVISGLGLLFCGSLFIFYVRSQIHIKFSIISNVNIQINDINIINIDLSLFIIDNQIMNFLHYPTNNPLF